MNESKIENRKSKIFLGVDGGQSHTEAIIADEFGNILGRGFGGASNHAEYPGGRERLRNAILKSVGKAVRDAAERKDQNTKKIRGDIPDSENVSNFQFASAHFGMTGGADYKEQIIGEIIKAEYLTVGHDAPTALFGATAGKAGVVVIAGTGSIVYGENEMGETSRIGGLGYLFSDEGSGFWLAVQTIRLAIKEHDNLIESSGLEEIVLNFFGRQNIREITDDFYNARMTREHLASFAQRAHEAAEGGNVVIRNQIDFGANVLVESVSSAARKLNFQIDFPVAGVGGMFRARLMKKYFAQTLQKKVPGANFTEPRFDPAIGALLVAYRQAGIFIGGNLLTNLEISAEQESAK